MELCRLGRRPHPWFQASVRAEGLRARWESQRRFRGGTETVVSSICSRSHILTQKVVVMCCFVVLDGNARPCQYLHVFPFHKLPFSLFFLFFSSQSPQEQGASFRENSEEMFISSFISMLTWRVRVSHNYWVFDVLRPQVFAEKPTVCFSPQHSSESWGMTRFSVPFTQSLLVFPGSLLPLPSLTLLTPAPSFPVESPTRESDSPVLRCLPPRFPPPLPCSRVPVSYQRYTVLH